jgi:hypothetical protein
VLRDLAGHRGRAFGRLGGHDVVVDRRDRGKQLLRVCAALKAANELPTYMFWVTRRMPPSSVRHGGRRPGDERGERKESDRHGLAEVTQGNDRSINGVRHPTSPLDAYEMQRAPNQQAFGCRTSFTEQRKQSPRTTFILRNIPAGGAPRGRATQRLP